MPFLEEPPLGLALGFWLADDLALETGSALVAEQVFEIGLAENAVFLEEQVGLVSEFQWGVEALFGFEKVMGFVGEFHLAEMEIRRIYFLEWGGGPAAGEIGKGNRIVCQCWKAPSSG